MKRLQARTGIKSLLAPLVALISAAAFSGCLLAEPEGSRQHPAGSTEGEITLNLRTGVQSVVNLNKSSAITLARLDIVMISDAIPSDTIRDTILAPRLNPVSTAPQTIDTSYSLKALRPWKIIVTSRDTRDSVIHRDSANVPALYAGSMASVNLNLSARYAVYEAQFLSLPGSIGSATGTGKQTLCINRLVLKVDGVTARDSSSSPAACFDSLNTHTLSHDYVSLTPRQNKTLTSGTGLKINGVQFTTRDTGYAVGAGGLALRTVNGGASWAPMGGTGTKPLYAVHFINQSRGWIVGDTIVYRTTNGGATWTPHTTLGNTSLRSVYFISPDTGYAVSSGGSVYRSIDGGAVWNLANSVRPGSLRFSGTATNHGWAVGTYGTFNVAKTTDRGANWVVQSTSTTANLRGVYPVNDNLVYAVGDAGTVLRTVDGGATWVNKTGVSGTTQDLKSVHFLDAATGFAVGSNGTIISTSDSGNTWKVETSPVAHTLNSIHFIGTRGYVGGDNGTLIEISGLRQIQMFAYGPMGSWNQADPLYSGTRYIDTSEEDPTIQLTLQWTGPTTGTGALTATLGKVKKVTVIGTLPGTPFP